MFFMLKKKKIYPVYVSKHKSNREKQVILLMIPNGEEWCYIAVKKLPALLREITPKDHDDFCCLNWLYSLATNMNLIKRYVKIKICVKLKCPLKTLKC